jgi:hypothetical protein
MKSAAGETFAPDPMSVSAWTPPLVVSGDAGNGLSAFSTAAANVADRQPLRQR